MPNIYVFQYRDPGKVAAHIINGSVANQLGGEFRRESDAGSGFGDAFQHENNRLVEVANRIFAWHTSAASASRIYRFDSSASSADISGLSGLFTEGETILGQTSSATATIVDASVVGDDFLIVNNISGTFTVGETILGQTSSATCVLASDFEQGGAAGYKGEWFVDHTISSTLQGTLAHTGLYALNIDGETGLAGLYITSGTQARSIKYDIGDDTWTESGDLGSSGVASNNEFGRCSIVGNSLIGTWAFGTSTSTLFTFTYAPATDAFGTQTFSVGSGTGRQQTFGSPIIEWIGRIFIFTQDSTQDTELTELAGGSWSGILELDGSIVGGRTQFIDNDMGNMLIIQRESLYLFHAARINASAATDGWTVAKFTNSSGTITCDNMTAAAVTADEGESMANFILPETLAVGLDADLPINEYGWRAYLDQETNDPNGDPLTVMWHVGNQAAVENGLVTDVLEWGGVEDISDQPGVTYTWNGSTTVTFTSGGTVVQDGDWIGLKSDNQLFEVSGTPSGGNITILNPASQTIPSGSTTSEILLSVVRKSDNLAVGRFAFSENIAKGGGHRTLPASRLDVEIVSIVPALGGETISYRAYSSSGTETVDISFFYGEANNQQPTAQASLSSPSSGTLNNNVIEGITADNSTIYTVVWNAQSDGAANGESRIIVPKISL